MKKLTQDECWCTWFGKYFVKHPLLFLSASIAAGATVIMNAAGVVMGTVPATVAGLSAGTWTVVGIATGLGSSVVGGVLHGVTPQEAKQLTESIKYFVDNKYAVLNPGETCHYSSSLSMSRSVWLMNQNGEQTSRICWTGAEDKSNIR